VTRGQCRGPPVGHVKIGEPAQSMDGLVMVSNTRSIQQLHGNVTAYSRYLRQRHVSQAMYGTSDQLPERDSMAFSVIMSLCHCGCLSAIWFRWEALLFSESRDRVLFPANVHFLSQSGRPSALTISFGPNDFGGINARSFLWLSIT
jgi:hypothetical protein